MGVEYFSQFIAVPDTMLEIDDIIARELAHVAGGVSTAQHRQQALLAGVRLRYAALRRSIEADDFFDASGVSRTRQGIAEHLGRLITPDDVAELRDPISELVGLCEVAELADNIASLHRLAPDVATALLELRPYRAWILLRSRIDDRPAQSVLGDYAFLVPEIARLRILYRLHLTAQDCAAQIHAPFGWRGLDDLQEFGTLRVSAIRRHLLAELELVEKAFDLFVRSKPLPATAAAMIPALCMTSSIAITIAAVNLPVSDHEAKRYRHLEDRARVQLAIWRRAHGADLELRLANEIRRRRRELSRMRAAIEAKADRLTPNAVMGNADTENAGLILWFAIEAAVAWISEPVRHDDDNIGRPLHEVLGSKLQEQESSAIGRAVSVMRTDPTGLRRLTPPPLHPEGASNVAALFDLYRVAFLRDDEMLPRRLRHVLNPETGETRAIRDHARAASIRGQSYTPDEILTGYEADRQDRMYPDRLWPNDEPELTKAQRDARETERRTAREQGMTRRTETRDSAASFPKEASRRRRFQMEARTRAFHGFVMRGLTTP